MESKAHTGLHCWIQPEAENVIVHLEGDIDLATAPLLADMIAAAFRQRPSVIVDLADVTYMNGAGLRVLRDAAQAHIGHLSVARPTTLIRRLFEIVQFTDLIMATSMDAAQN